MRKGWLLRHPRTRLDHSSGWHVVQLGHVDGCWIALQVKCRFEPVAAAVLASASYRVSLPRMRDCNKCTARCGGRPLFPGYLFCRYDAHNAWSIARTPGVVKIVSFGSTVPVLEDDEVDGLMLASRVDRCRRPVSLMDRGDIVEITQGPLAGLRGRYLFKKNKHLVVISVKLLNRAVAVELRHSDKDCAETILCARRSWWRSA